MPCHYIIQIILRINHSCFQTQLYYQHMIIFTLLRYWFVLCRIVIIIVFLKNLHPLHVFIGLLCSQWSLQEPSRDPCGMVGHFEGPPQNWQVGIWILWFHLQVWSISIYSWPCGWRCHSPDYDSSSDQLNEPGDSCMEWWKTK